MRKCFVVGGTDWLCLGYCKKLRGAYDIIAEHYLNEWDCTLYLYMLARDDRFDFELDNSFWDFDISWRGDSIDIEEYENYWIINYSIWEFYGLEQLRSSEDLFNKCRIELPHDTIEGSREITDTRFAQIHDLQRNARSDW